MENNVVSYSLAEERSGHVVQNIENPVIKKYIRVIRDLVSPDFDWHSLPSQSRTSTREYGLQSRTDLAEPVKFRNNSFNTKHYPPKKNKIILLNVLKACLSNLRMFHLGW